MRLVLAVVLASFAASAAAQAVSRDEKARLKAEASRPPSAAERKKMTAQVKSLDFPTLCAELGRALRSPRATARGKHWDSLIVARANVPSGDVRSIRARKLSLGIDECSAIAILGKPDSMVRTGESNQLVYRERSIYVFTDNGVVRAWQD
jgi:hypothetical protein